MCSRSRVRHVRLVAPTEVLRVDPSTENKLKLSGKGGRLSGGVPRCETVCPVSVVAWWGRLCAVQAAVCRCRSRGARPVLVRGGVSRGYTPHNRG